MDAAIRRATLVAGLRAERFRLRPDDPLVPYVIRLIERWVQRPDVESADENDLENVRALLTVYLGSRTRALDVRARSFLGTAFTLVVSTVEWPNGEAEQGDVNTLRRYVADVDAELNKALNHALAVYPDVDLTPFALETRASVLRTLTHVAFSE